MSLCHCRVCQRLVASLLWSVALHPQQVHIQAHGATIQTSFSTLAALGMAPSACMQKRLRRVSAAMLPLFKGLTGEHGALQERSPYAAQMDCPLAPHVTQAHGERGQEGTPASVGCARRYPSGGAEGLPVGARCHVGARRGNPGGGGPVSLGTAALLGASTLELSQPGGHLSEKGGSHVAQTGCPLAPGVMQARGEGLDRGTPVSLDALALLWASTLSSLSRVATSSGDTHSL